MPDHSTSAQDPCSPVEEPTPSASFEHFRQETASQLDGDKETAAAHSAAPQQLGKRVASISTAELPADELAASRAGASFNTGQKVCLSESVINMRHGQKLVEGYAEQDDNVVVDLKRTKVSQKVCSDEEIANMKHGQKRVVKGCAEQDDNGVDDLRKRAKVSTLLPVPVVRAPADPPAHADEIKGCDPVEGGSLSPQGQRTMQAEGDPLQPPGGVELRQGYICPGFKNYEMPQSRELGQPFDLPVFDMGQPQTQQHLPDPHSGQAGHAAAHVQPAVPDEDIAELHQLLLAQPGLMEEVERAHATLTEVPNDGIGESLQLHGAAQNDFFLPKRLVKQVQQAGPSPTVVQGLVEPLRSASQLAGEVPFGVVNGSPVSPDPVASPRGQRTMQAVAGDPHANIPEMPQPPERGQLFDQPGFDMGQPQSQQRLPDSNSGQAGYDAAQAQPVVPNEDNAELFAEMEDIPGWEGFAEEVFSLLHAQPGFME